MSLGFPQKNSSGGTALWVFGREFPSIATVFVASAQFTSANKKYHAYRIKAGIVR